MYAIIQDGDKQYRVEPGQTVSTEKKPLEPGSQVEFDKVLLVRDGEKLLVGTPLVEGAKVVADVQKQIKGEKLVAYKYRKREGYHRKKGHRQRYTQVMIKDIVVP